MITINISHKKFKEVEAALKNNDWNSDNAYQELMQNEGLFCHAFYGWAASPYQKQKMSHIWRAVVFVKYESDKFKREWQKENVKKFLQL